MTKAETEMVAREQRERERRRMRWEAACAALTGLLSAEANPQAQGYPRPSDKAAAYRFADSSIELADALVVRFEESEPKP